MSTLDTPTRSVPDLDPALAGRLTTRIADDAGTDEDYAQRILQQALTFLDYAGRVGRMCAPSPDVDEGWHAFILYTDEYARHTMGHYGRYIQHMPDDDPTKPSSGPNFVETAHDMEEAGYWVDWDLWMTMLAPRTDPRGSTVDGRSREHLPLTIHTAESRDCHTQCQNACQAVCTSGPNITITVPDTCRCHDTCTPCRHIQPGVDEMVVTTGCYPGLIRVADECHINEPQCNPPDCHSPNVDEDDERTYGGQ